MYIIDFIRQHKLLYEIAQLTIDPIKAYKSRKNNDAFSQLSLTDIMRLDAEMYYERQHKRLDWSNLQTYTEIMQWEKIFDDNPQKCILADKYLVRDWVAGLIGEEYLIPLLGHWKKYSDIRFDELPNSFVIKTNHGSSDVVVVRDKRDMSLSDKMRMKRIITTSMRTNYSSYAYEMHYSHIDPMIIVEKFIDSGESDLRDYKFLCFNGVPYFCWVDIGRYTNHKRNIYDLDWNLQNWNQFHYGNSNDKIEKPANFDKMIEIARILSRNFSHVRVDLYNVSGRIYFGEMTFTNGSGFEEITPEGMDLKLGRMWGITPKIKVDL